MSFRSVIFSVAMVLWATSAQAQLSVTTLGATDAAQCFQNANDEFTNDTNPCDKALADRATTRTDRKKALVNRGIIFNRMDRVDAALRDFNEALGIDDDLAEAWLNRGNSFFRAGRYDEALADYEKALALDVAQPWAAWYNIGLVYDAQKRPDEAREAYQNSLSLNPDFALARRKLERKPKE